MGLVRRLRNTFFDHALDDEFRAEAGAYFDELVREAIRNGASKERAEFEARSRMGNLALAHDETRDAEMVRWLDDLARDVRHAVRQLRRAPVFAATAVVTLALGIGANALAFSILNAVLIRELPYRNPDRIVLVTFSPADAPETRGGATLQNYLAVRDRSRSFEFVGSASGATGSIATAPDDLAGAEPVAGQRIHATLSRVLGVQPALGTWFSEADDPPTAPRKLILSQRLWRRLFDADPRAIGRLIRMDSEEATIIGVMPEGFEFLDPSAQFWTASRWSEATMTSPSRMLTVAARLKPGITLSQAQAEMNLLAAALAQEFPRTNKGWGIHLESIYDTYTRAARGPLLLLQSVVTLVILIACANVAGLLLAQASTRQSELAIRLALGSGRGRLVRQLFAESLLLSCLGCVCGIALAVAGLRLFMAQNPTTWLPRAASITLDERVLLFTMAMTAASSVAFGLLPSLAVSRSALNASIRRANPLGRVSHQRVRGMLVAGQVAAAFVLLTAAGLLLNTLVRLDLNRPTIDFADLVTFRVRLPLREMVTPTGRDAEGFFAIKFSPRVTMIFRQIQEQLSDVPGVRSVAGSIVPPMTLDPFQFEVARAGRPAGSDGGTVTAAWFPISPDYFRTLGITVKGGREFTTRDSLSTTQVAIVNETLARRLWPGQDPLGREITIDFVNDAPRRIVGVALDVRETSEQHQFAPHVFVPEAQLPLASRGWFQSPRITMTYVVRTATDPLPLVDRLRSAVAGVYRTQPIYDVTTMKEALSSELAPRRQYLMLLVAFAGIAAVLAFGGVYGLVAYGVGQRTNEIGIRSALGASAGAILSLVLRQGLILTGVGISIGIAASLALTRVLKSLLWGVSPTDPVTFSLVAIGLAAAALLACYLPARRALRISPIVALRSE